MYDLIEHRHRFSVWAAARAAQRAWTRIEVLRDAVEGSGVVEFAKDGTEASISHRDFDQLHVQWCGSIIRKLLDGEIAGTTYGRAAKLVAVYLKSMVILGPCQNFELIRVIHPPIDRILLRNISRSAEIRLPPDAKCRIANWTQLDQTQYFRLLEELRAVVSSEDPLWTLERFWTVTDGG